MVNIITPKVLSNSETLMSISVSIKHLTIYTNQLSSKWSNLHKAKIKHNRKGVSWRKSLKHEALNVPSTQVPKKTQLCPTLPFWNMNESRNVLFEYLRRSYLKYKTRRNAESSQNSHQYFTNATLKLPGFRTISSISSHQPPHTCLKNNKLHFCIINISK